MKRAERTPEEAAERAEAIARIVAEAPPLSPHQIAVLSRIFEGASGRIRARREQQAGEVA